MKANTGMSPDGAFLAFSSKDTTKFIPKPDSYRQRFNDTNDSTEYISPRGGVPVGTTKCTYKLGLTSHDGLPKLDRALLNITTKNFPRNPTDLLSFDKPNEVKPFQRVYDSIVTSHRYDRNVRNTNKWADQTITVPSLKTLGSVEHNIITHERNDHSPCNHPSIFSRQRNNRQKSITEYSDFARLTAYRPNKDFQKAIEKDPLNFNKKDGIFTHLYNSAARLHVEKPFAY